MTRELSKRWRVTFCLLVCALVSGCSLLFFGGRSDTDGIPTRPISEIMKIPEPTPQWEPRATLGNHSPYEVFGKTYRVLSTAEGYSERGIASWYGTKFHGRKTSSGEPYDVYKITAAHKSLPLPTYVKVTNLENSRSLVVRVNDRGPFKDGRIIDLSYAAAVQLGVFPRGTARVQVETIPAEKRGFLTRMFSRDASESEKGTFFVQAGAFSSRDNAEQLRERIRLQELGSTSMKTSRADRLFRVLVGPFTTRGEAEYAKQQLQESFGIRALIVD